MNELRALQVRICCLDSSLSADNPQSMASPDSSFVEALPGRVIQSETFCPIELLHLDLLMTIAPRTPQKLLAKEKLSSIAI